MKLTEISAMDKRPTHRGQSLSQQEALDLHYRLRVALRDVLPEQFRLRQRPGESKTNYPDVRRSEGLTRIYLTTLKGKLSQSDAEQILPIVQDTVVEVAGQNANFVELGTPGPRGNIPIVIRFDPKR